nr:MAG TPA: hypothetical protein [Caudoviricetes sp.]
MVAISKMEKDMIRAKFPNVHIVRTMKSDSHRHHYYCEEARGVMQLLQKMRAPEEERREKPRKRR